MLALAAMDLYGIFPLRLDNLIVHMRVNIPYREYLGILLGAFIGSLYVTHPFEP